MFNKKPHYILYAALAICFIIVSSAFINRLPHIMKNVEEVMTVYTQARNLAINNHDLQSVLGKPIETDFMPNAFHIEDRKIYLGFDIQGPNGSASILTRGLYQSEKKEWKINLEFTKDAQTKDGKRYVIIVHQEGLPELVNKPASIREIPVFPEQSFLSEFYHELGETLPWDNSFINNAKWLQKAVDHGNADAANDLSLYYAYGQGVEKDTIKEIAYQELGAERGSYEAIYNLGLNYRTAPKPDYALALQWYQHYLAVTPDNPYYSSIGHACTYTDLGLMYAKGQGTEVNMQKADGYLHDAAENLLLGMENSDEDHADKVAAYIAYQKLKYVEGKETDDLFWKYPANVVYAAELMSNAIKKTCWD